MHANPVIKLPPSEMAPLPSSEIVERWKKPLRISLGVHVLIAVVLFFKDSIFGPPLPLTVSTLRVDLVGLPDVLKKDLVPLPLPASQEAESSPEQKDVAPPPTAPTPAQPDEMSLATKRSTKSPPKKDETTEVKPTTASPAKLKSALARIKALNRIEGETAAPQVKGNVVSRGTEVGGDAQEGAEATYFDLLKQRIQSQWKLPVWLARQNLSARVTVFLGPQGGVQQIRFDQSSGTPAFDEEVKRAIQSASPFPPPPAEYRASVLLRGVSFGFPL